MGVVSLSNAVAASGTHNAMLGLRAFMDRKVRGGMGFQVFPGIPSVKSNRQCLEGFSIFCPPQLQTFNIGVDL